MKEGQNQDENTQSSTGNNLYIWDVVENIVTIIVTAGLFYLTSSLWCFLLLINLNTKIFKK